MISLQKKTLNKKYHNLKIMTALEHVNKINNKIMRLLICI